MLDRRLLLAAGISLALIAPAFAYQSIPFDKAAFEAAQKAGAPILIEIHAPWCPVCKSQGVVLGELLKQPEFAKVKVFRIDFDSQKDLLRAFNAQKQSTLIMFKGAQETSRVVAESHEMALEPLLKSAF